MWCSEVLLLTCWVCVVCGGRPVSAQANATVPCVLTRGTLFSDIASCGEPSAGALSRGSLEVGAMGVGTSTLDDVQSHFSPAAAFRLRRGESAPLGVCIKTDTGDAAVFVASPAGGWKDVTGIYLARANLLESLGAKCTASRKLNKAATRSGLRPGMARADFYKKIGVQPADDVNVAFHFMTAADKAPWSKTGQSKETSDVRKALTGVYAGFSSGRVEWLFLYGIESD